MSKFALTIALLAAIALDVAVAQATGNSAGPGGLHNEPISAFLWMMMAGAVLAITPGPILKAIRA